MPGRRSPANYAGFDVPRQELDTQRVEGGAYRGYLGEDVHAVPIFFNHPLDAGHLACDSVHSRFELFLSGVLHDAHLLIPARGILTSIIYHRGVYVKAVGMAESDSDSAMAC